MVNKTKILYLFSIHNNNIMYKGRHFLFMDRGQTFVQLIKPRYFSHIVEVRIFVWIKPVLEYL